MSLRLITGPVLIALLISLCLLDEWLGSRGTLHPGTVLLAACVIILVIGGLEMTRIIRGHGLAACSILTIGAALAGLACTVLLPACHPDSGSALIILASCLAVLSILSFVFFSRKNPLAAVLPATGCVLLSFTWLGMLMGVLLSIRTTPLPPGTDQFHSAWMICGIILTIKAFDTGALTAGRLAGKHKLAPGISPGKTWEGVAGGTAAAAIVGLAFAALSRSFLGPLDHITPLTGALGGAAIGLCGQAGDLVMSVFKRGANRKDSSDLLPGLGGILDIIDSPLLAAPVAWWILHLASGG